MGAEAPEKFLSEESPSDESLDAFVMRIDAALDKHLDARLKTIEAKLDRLCLLADGLDKVAEEMAKNPMIAGLIGAGGAGGSGDGFKF